jgi:DNA-binding XRE family transcriptional regulator
MTGKEFTKWRCHMGLSKTEVASLLGVTRQAPYLWEAGKRPIQKATELACAALTLGIRDYPAKGRNGRNQLDPQPVGTDGSADDTLRVLAAPFSGPAMFSS